MQSVCNVSGVYECLICSLFAYKFSKRMARQKRATSCSVDFLTDFYPNLTPILYLMVGMAFAALWDGAHESPSGRKDTICINILVV